MDFPGYENRIVELIRSSLHVQENLANSVVSEFTELKKHFEQIAKNETTDDCTGIDQEEGVLFACLMIIARGIVVRLAATDNLLLFNHHRIPISKIVTAAGSNLFDVFRELPTMIRRVSCYIEQKNLSVSAIETACKLRELQKCLLISGLLVKKYKDLFASHLSSLEFYKQTVLKLGWSLFIVFKFKLLPQFPDLVSCMELLVVVVAILSYHVEIFKGAEKCDAESCLRTISDQAHTDYGRVSSLAISVAAVMSTALPAILQVWRNAGQQPCPETHLSSIYEGLVNFPDRMSAVIEACEREYEVFYLRSGDLDERDLLTADFSILASPWRSPCVAPSQSQPPALLNRALPQRPSVAGSFSRLSNISPRPAGMSPVMGTPVTKALTAVSWLRALTDALPSEPSAELLHALSIVANENFIQLLPQRVAGIVGDMFSDAPAPNPGTFLLRQHPVMEEQRMQTTKLYYQVLNIFLKPDPRSASPVNATRPILSHRFHKSLLACCSEVVGAAHRSPMTFPRVLTNLSLAAFDMLIVMDQFLRALPSLPSELRRHVAGLEEKILEVHVWEPSSSLFPLVEAAATQAASLEREPESSTGSAETRFSGSPGEDSGEGTRTRSSCNEDTSPMSPSAKKARWEASLAAQSSSDSLGFTPVIGVPPPGGWTGSLLPLSDLVRRLLGLAETRLARLVEELNTAPYDKSAVLVQAHGVFRHVLLHATYMLYNRHLDTILLCALYGWAKINKLQSITFKDIIAIYMRLRPGRQDVFRSVVVKQCSRTLQVVSQGDIIAFYNQNFAKGDVGTYLRQLEPLPLPSVSISAPAGAAAHVRPSGTGIDRQLSSTPASDSKGTSPPAAAAGKARAALEAVSTFPPLLAGAPMVIAPLATTLASASHLNKRLLEGNFTAASTDRQERSSPAHHLGEPPGFGASAPSSRSSFEPCHGTRSHAAALLSN